MDCLHSPIVLLLIHIKFLFYLSLMIHQNIALVNWPRSWSMVSWELQIHRLVCYLIQNLLSHPGLQCWGSFVSSMLVSPVVTYTGWFRFTWLGYLYSAVPSAHITPRLHVDLAWLVICLDESTKSCWVPRSICRARRSTIRHSSPFYSIVFLLHHTIVVSLLTPCSSLWGIN